MRNWLKEMRKKKNLTQLAIAERLNVSLSYYSLIENGERKKNLDLPIVMKLSEILGVSVEYIIEKEKALL